jgi:tetratricopeptide (TPR) repeat protein
MTLEEQIQYASSLHRQGLNDQAIEAFRALLREHPDAAESWYELGYLLKTKGNYEEANVAFANAIAHHLPNPEEAHLNRAVIFADHLRRDALAETELRAALQINPDYAPALLNLGNLQEEQGLRDEALQSYNTLLSGRERFASYPALVIEALARACNLRSPKTTDDPMFTELESGAAAVSRYSSVTRTNVLFALGHAYEKVSSYEQAFDAYRRGNRAQLRATGRRYDPTYNEQLTTNLISAFSHKAECEGTSAGIRPLFICGMFRSGSTLIEQVLGTHPQVQSGGELDYLMRLAAERLNPFPQSVTQLQSADFRAMAAQYQAHLIATFPEATHYVTDKRPDNFLLIGLIKQMFPNALIVHTTRDPMDNGLSVYLQHLVHDVAPYSSDLEDIAHYYGQYRRLMKHWKSLYADTIFDFSYDDFVANPQNHLGGLLSFLDLPDADNMLEFYKRKSTVKTASYWQVRQPLHTSSSGRWRNYNRQLEPLAAAFRANDIIE